MKKLKETLRRMEITKNAEYRKKYERIKKEISMQKREKRISVKRSI